MPEVQHVKRVWHKGSTTSSSSTSSTPSHRSGSSRHSQYTTNTSYSDFKAEAKYSKGSSTQKYNPQPEVNPRSSCETYASTTVDECEDSYHQVGICPPLRARCYKPDAVAATSCEFSQLFPSTRRLLIQHDDTSLDGNLNLRVDTEVPAGRGHMMKVTLFHLKMNDLSERQFSLRRYQRASGREVCNSKRKYLKPATRPSISPRKLSLTNVLTKMSLKSLAVKPRAKVVREPCDSESEDEFDFSSAEVKATIPTKVIRLEFSNYAQVELERNERSERSMYDFEYWGEQFSWRRNMIEDDEDDEGVFSLDLVNVATGGCIAHIIPDKISRAQEREEAHQGSWVPPCSMRITEKRVPSDLGDVIVATGLLALTDDCIRGRWREAHRL
ncbi:hypothetical protein B0A52_00944 [Exophiala mesophila]|uniref:Uncharacterized protein n=1 Tax=Exophiala mesophila TaxID=212818 RepID=A0A438NIP3_EXOME|nr:hypothetical protein B0A52_00944 [Exophiala mesophila]